MKFFHLSDLHIGLKLMNHDLKEDQEYILRQVVEFAGKEQPEAVVIAGDIYDKAIPPAEAVDTFDRFVSALAAAVPRAEIMMISGNHDSAARINVFRSILQRQHVHMIGLPPRTEKEAMEKVVLKDSHGPVNFYLLPFVRPSMVRTAVGAEDALSYNDALHLLIEREKIDERERNVLVSHQFYLPAGTDAEAVERMDSEIRTVGNIDEVKADILERFDYAALGHIHKPMKVGSDTCRYCGTPMACSVSEAGQEKGILMVELEGKGQVRTTVLPLVPLREIRIVRGTLGEVLEQGCEDFVVAALTDTVDLDVIDMQDRLHHAFPNLLEIRREAVQEVDYSQQGMVMEKLQPFELISAFLKDLDDEEKDLVRDVLCTVQGVN